MHKEILEIIFGDILTAIDEGQSQFKFGDVDFDESGESIDINYKGKQYIIKCIENNQ